MAPADESHSRFSRAGALRFLVPLAVLCTGFVLGCGSEDQVAPGTDPDAVVWTKLTSLPRAATDNLRDFQALYPDWRGDSVVFNGLDPITSNSLRLAYVHVNDGAGAYVSSYPGPAPWNDITPKWVGPGLVVFASSRDINAKFDIYYRNVDTGVDHRLMTTPEYETHPIPRLGTPGLAYVDGQDSRNGRLVYMPDTANVANRTFLTRASLKLSEPAWDPTGTKIVFSADSTEGALHFRHIWWVAIGDTTAHQLTSGPYQDDYPVFKPDGSTIVFESDRSSRSSLWLVDPVQGESAGLKRIAWQDPGPQIYFPVWSPDGTRIMVTVDGDGSGRQIWILSNLDLTYP